MTRTGGTGSFPGFAIRFLRVSPGGPPYSVQHSIREPRGGPRGRPASRGAAWRPACRRTNAAASVCPARARDRARAHRRLGLGGRRRPVAGLAPRPRDLSEGSRRRTVHRSEACGDSAEPTTSAPVPGLGYGPATGSDTDAAAEAAA